MQNVPFSFDRPQKLLLVSSAVFFTALVVAEATGSKFFTLIRLPFAVTILGMSFTEVVMTAGVLSFPITFIFTDLLNDLYGKRVIRFITLVGMVMILFEYLILQAAIRVPAAPISPVSGEAFQQVFGSAGRIIFGSLAAYLVGQMADISLFHTLRRMTGGRHLWLRATGSTFGSQFIDTFIVLTVAFSGTLRFQEIMAVTLFNYLYKFIIAVLITPLIYLAHGAMERYLGKETVHAMQQQAK